LITQRRLARRKNSRWTANAVAPPPRAAECPGWRGRRGTARGLLFLALLLALCLPALPLAAQPVSPWSPPERLGDDTFPNWFPSLATDATGRIHAVWSRSDDGFDMALYAVSEDGVSWSSSVDIVAQELGDAGESYVSRPVLDAGVDGTLVLAYHGQGDDLLLFASAFDSGLQPRSWGEGEWITTGYHGVPVVGVDGAIHLITTDFASSPRCARCLALNYRQRAAEDSTWSLPVDVGQDGSMGAAKPTLIVDGDLLYVTWEAGLDGDRGYVAGDSAVMFSRSTDQGRSWSRPFALDDPTVTSLTSEGPPPSGEPRGSTRNVTLGQDGSGALVPVWWSEADNLVAYRYSNDGGMNWSAPQTIPGVYGVGRRSTTSQDRYTIARDGAGRLHLLLVGSRTPDVRRLELLHLVWDGRGWSQSEVVASSETDLLEWPAAAVRLGNELHVSWHVRPDWLVAGSDPAPFTVWHSMRLLDAPALAPVALPTSPAPAAPTATAPPPSPTPSPSPTPAPALLLTREASQGPDAGGLLPSNIRSENDEVLLVSLALLPVALVIIAALLVAVRRSRKRRI
jgi:hypothetical protein